MFADGYKYWLAYKKNNTSYYRCSRYKTQCPARCMVEDSKIRNTTAHNHPPEPDRVLVDKFRKALTQRAASEQTDLYSIYLEEASQRHSDAALLYTFNAAESAMRKARRKQLPLAPSTIQELSDILSTSKLFRIHSGSKREQFYQTTLTIDDVACVIFIHYKTLDTLGPIEELHINHSLNIQSESSSAYHLLIVHAVQSFSSIPIVYVIMTATTESSYAAVFAYIRENLSQISPSTIMSNYDSDILSALTYTYPEVTVKGYWFQYTDAVLKNVKQNNLQRETNRGHNSSGLRMLLVLPLLPAEYMAPGLEAIRKWAQEKRIYTSAFEQLCAYIEQNWLRSVGAEKMSVFGMPHSVYNHTQLFNKELRNSLGNDAPLIWHVLESITHIATRAFVKCMKQSKHPKSRQPNKSQQAIDTIVENATQLWIRTPVHLRNPLQFLQLTSHCINEATFGTVSDDSSFDKTSRSTSILVTSSEPFNSAASTLSSIISSSTSGRTLIPRILIPTKGPSIELTIPVSSAIATISTEHQIHARSLSTTTMDHSQGEFEQNPGSNVVSVNDNTTNFGIFTTDGSATLITDACTTSAIASAHRIFTSTDPPPLAFFPKNCNRSQKPIIFSATEPPPLVPIQRFVN